MALVTRNSELISATVDDDLVMMSMTKGEYYGISGVGARIWELLAEPTTLDSIVDTICTEYEVEPQVCRADVEEFVTRLGDLGLVSEA